MWLFGTWMMSQSRSCQVTGATGEAAKWVCASVHHHLVLPFPVGTLGHWCCSCCQIRAFHRKYLSSAVLWEMVWISGASLLHLLCRAWSCGRGVEEDLPNKCLMLLSLCNWGLVLLRPQWWGEKTQSVHWNAKCTDIAFQRDPMEGEKCCCSSSPTLLLPGGFESFSYNKVRMLGFRIIAVAWLPLLHPDTFRMEVQEVCTAIDAFSVSCRLDPAQKPSPQVNCGQILSIQNHPETDHWRQQG